MIAFKIECHLEKGTHEQFTIIVSETGHNFGIQVSSRITRCSVVLKANLLYNLSRSYTS